MDTLIQCYYQQYLQQWKYCYILHKILNKQKYIQKIFLQHIQYLNSLIYQFIVKIIFLNNLLFQNTLSSIYQDSNSALNSSNDQFYKTENGFKACENESPSDLYKCKFNMFNDRGFAFEAVRQWSVCIISLGMIAQYIYKLYTISYKIFKIGSQQIKILSTDKNAYFIYCIIRMYKIHRKMTFDIIILMIEVLKIFLLWLHEFIFIEMVALLIILIFQSQIRAIVCANFIHKAMKMSNPSSNLKVFNFIYYGVIVSINISTIVLSVLKQTRLSCESSLFSFHWFIVCGVDMIQSLIILITSFKIRQQINKRNNEQNEKYEELHDDKQYNCLQSQVKYLAYFYVLFSMVDIIMLVVGNQIDQKGSETFICMDNWYMMSESVPASIFLLFDNIVLYLITILIWFIFYRLPDYYGLLGSTKASDLVMSKSTKSSGASTTDQIRHNSQAIEDFMRMSQNFDTIPIFTNIDQRKSSVQVSLVGGGLGATQLQRPARSLKGYGNMRFGATQVGNGHSNLNANLLNSNATTAGFNHNNDQDNITQNNQANINSPDKHTHYNPVQEINNVNGRDFQSVVSRRKKKYDQLYSNDNKGSMMSKGDRKTSPYRPVQRDNE